MCERFSSNLMLGACAGTLAGLLLDVVSLFFPLYYVNHLVVGCVTVGILAGLIIGIARIPDRKKAALIADSKGLDERLVTSLESLDKEGGFHSLQRKDTVSKIETFNLKKNIRISFPCRKLPILAVLIIGVVICSRVDSPARRLARDNHALNVAVEEKAEKLEKVLKEMEDNSLLSKEEKETLNELLQAASDELNEVLKKEKIDTVMERLDTKLKKEEEKSSSQALSKEVEAIQEKLNLPSSEQRQQRQSELAKNLEDALKELNGNEGKKAGGLSEEELEQLAKELADQMMESEDWELSEAEISDLANTMKVSPEDLKASLSKAGSQSQQTASQENDGSTVSAKGQNGSGSGNNGGSGSGSGNGGRGQGGTGWDVGSKNGFEKVTEVNDAPEQLNIPDRATGDDENLTGTNTEGSSYLTDSDMGLSFRGQSVDYSRVVGEYTTSAMSRLNQSKIPDAMKDVVKKYFSELNQ